ncbi:MAG: hypothetical protein ACK4NM_18770, partial [Hydrogenophaga sp.]
LAKQVEPAVMRQQNAEAVQKGDHRYVGLRAQVRQRGGEMAHREQQQQRARPCWRWLVARGGVWKHASLAAPPALWQCSALPRCGQQLRR